MLRPALLVLSGLLCLSFVHRSDALQHCESCGTVCINFCNTREFRPCCINYIRKRSPQPPVPPSRLQLAAPPASNGLQPDAETGDRSWQDHIILSRTLPGFILDPASQEEAEV